MLGWFVLSFAAFFAGGLNALAGGGTFLTLPALLFAGVPPVAANTTSAAVVLPGYAGAALGYREALRQIPQRRLLGLALLAVLGAIAGASLLLRTSDASFRSGAPFLVLLATAMFAGKSLLQRRSKSLNSVRPLLGGSALLGVCGYGGYFNGGLGIALLAVLALFGVTRLDQANALKSVLSFVLTLTSVLTFAIAGTIQWQLALNMMLFSTLGGYLGARLALNWSATTLNRFVIGVGLTVAVLLFSQKW